MAKNLSTENLIRLAEDSGISVEWHVGNPKGKWIPARGSISLRHDLTEVQARCTLAHELGHAHCGHPAGHNSRDEKEADRYAARLLISAAEYALAEQTYGPHPARIAAELGITQNLLIVWRDMWKQKFHTSSTICSAIASKEQSNSD